MGVGARVSRRGGRWLALTAAPLANAVGRHLILSFVGRRRALAWLLYLGYAVFGGLAAWSLLAFLFPALRPVIASATWALALGLLMGPNLVLVVPLLQRHQRRALDVQEQMRTRLILLATVLLVMMAGTDLAVLLGQRDGARLRAKGGGCARRLALPRQPGEAGYRGAPHLPVGGAGVSAVPRVGQSHC